MRRQFDPAALLGLVVGAVLVLAGQAMDGGTIASLFQPSAAFVVFGGTAGAVLVTFSIGELGRAFMSLRDVMWPERRPAAETIASLSGYAIFARRAGLLALEERVADEPDPFLAKGLQLAIDNTPAGAIRDLLEIEIAQREEVEDVPSRVFEAAGGYAPTLGILGAVLGLIHVMENLTVPGQLGPGIAIAFVATVYGVGAANLLFLPVAARLRDEARRRTQHRLLLLEGVIAIRDGVNPRMLEQKLWSLAGHDGVPAPRTTGTILTRPVESRT
jgi:chemotaxis protein MotA